VNGARALLAAAIAAGLSSCSFFKDPASALVSAIETGARELESSAAFKSTIVHPPSPSSGDCPDAYRVQLLQQGPLTVWCLAPDDPAKIVSTHITTSHLKYVDVRDTTIVDKKRGEPLSIELAKSAGKPVIERVF
jgi:hypothetical protein